MKQRPTLEPSDVMQLVAACKREAARQGVAVTIAVADDGGHLLHLERIAARPSTVEVARRKALTAALMRTATSSLAARVVTNPALLALDAMPIGGGIPLLIGTDCVGAVGVSGGTVEQDEAIACAGSAVLVPTT